MNRRLKSYLIGLGLVLCWASCTDDHRPSTSLDIVGSTLSGISFNNKLDPEMGVDILSYLYYYNGGGVAVGDLNNDGLVDIYFTGNQVDDRLYFNKGELQFEDVTAVAGIKEDNSWSSGVVIVDINGDGWNDIYVSKVAPISPSSVKNQLYINQKDGTFVESAAAYHLDYSGYSTHSAFFDYDGDGDLDCYLLNHNVKNPEQFAKSSIRNRVDTIYGDRLFRNDDSIFTDVTTAAGIYSSSIGFGLGLAVSDFNMDGWPDIYIGNDFHEQDYLYINQQDGTFSERSTESMGHTSNFTMGVNTADLDNDEDMDIVSLDMKPEDHSVYKESGGWENIQIYNYKRNYGYHHQSPRNMLQINESNKTDGNTYFSEQGRRHKVDATDWSWSPLIGDLDNDGDQDIYITNGILKRPNNMDFVNFYSNEQKANNKDFLDKMPSGLVQNYWIKQEARAWNKQKHGDPSATTGGVLSDLDNDGDLDLVLSNINQTASIYENLQGGSYIGISLDFKPQNRQAIGSLVKLYQGEQVQSRYVSTTGGFQSSSDVRGHFGLGRDDIDSIVVKWPNGTMQTILNIPRDTMISIAYAEADTRAQSIKIAQISYAIDTTTLIHQDGAFNDQTREKWLPYLLSDLGPKMVLDQQTLWMTSGQGILLQEQSLDDTVDPIRYASIEKNIDGQSIAFIDYDGDQDRDIYLGVGGNELESGNLSIADRMYKNTGNGYKLDLGALPLIAENTSVVAVTDLGNDGYEDAFVGVWSLPGRFGESRPSYLLTNENGKLKRSKNLTNEMVTDAQWGDLDNDGDQDLVVVGHWMPIMIFRNEDDTFTKEEIVDSEGLYQSVTLEDIDGNGRLDILAGNWGGNFGESHKGHQSYGLFINDLNEDGIKETIVSNNVNGQWYPLQNLDQLAEGAPWIKKKYLHHADFAQQSIQEIFPQLGDTPDKSIKTLQSGIYLNDSNGWTWEGFPSIGQQAPIWDIVSLSNGLIAVGGNYESVDPSIGKLDGLGLRFLQRTKSGWIERKDLLIPSMIHREVRSLVWSDEVLYVGIHKAPVLAIKLSFD